MHRPSQIVYLEAKLEPSDKKGEKKTDISRDGIFHKNSEIQTFWPQKKWRNFGIFESITSWQETKNIHIKLATTCNKNEQQQDARNNAEI
jgi:hypothetical protein